MACQIRDRLNPSVPHTIEIKTEMLVSPTSQTFSHEMIILSAGITLGSNVVSTHFSPAKHAGRFSL